MKYTQIKQNFIYPRVDHKHYRFGNRLFGEIVNTKGDWRSYLPPEEDQNKFGIESSACYIEGQQHAIATLQGESFALINQNYSARFNALKSKGSESGGDPLAGAESIRTDGLIADELMPFSEIIISWQEYHSWKGTDQKKCEEEGKKFLENWTLNYDIVFERDEKIDIKYRKLRQALQYVPVPMSVLGWYQNDAGEYQKPEGTQDNHLVLCVYLDEKNRPYFWDTYAPYLKIGEPYYSSDFAMRWGVVKKTTPSKPSLWERILHFLTHLFI